MSFINKVVLVTGAGSGIGEAIAKRFAKQSARLSLVDINEINLHRVAEECELSKVEVIKVVADLSKDESVRSVVDDTLKEFGRIDAIVNCAGIHGTGGILDEDLMDRFDKIIAVNLRSVVALTNYAAPALIESKGAIVNISSVSAILTTANTIPYNVSKIGLTHFTRCAALELADKGVRVNSISPGPVQTRILTNAGMSEEEDTAFWNNCAETVPLKRLVDPDEVAALAQYLASDEAKSITGSDFVIDCGLVLSGSQAPPSLK